MLLTSLLLALPLSAVTPAPQDEPKTKLVEAIELAKAFTQKHQIDLSRHYMDSVWIRPAEGDSERCWIVSWSPKPEDADKTEGRIAITVAFDGTAAKLDHGAKTKSIRQRVIVPPQRAD
ncbi:hypothetical protein Hhel01_04315 [Haloferula helveola]